MNYALIGCGRIATNHIKAAVNNKLNIVAVCDVLPEAMEALLAKHGLENDASIKRYTDYKQMLAENDITLASIATESGIHAEIALHCIDNGVNVIIEKPMAMSMADAEEIIRRSEEKGVKVVQGIIDELLTVQEMAGFQMILCVVDDEQIKALNAKSDTPYWTSIGM